MRIYYPCFANKRALDNRRPNRFEVNAQTQFQAVTQQVSTHLIPTKLAFIRNGINKMLHGTPCPISFLFLLPYKYYIYRPSLNMKSIFAAIAVLAATVVSAQNIVSITSPLTGTVYTAGQPAVITW